MVAQQRSDGIDVKELLLPHDEPHHNRKGADPTRARQPIRRFHRFGSGGDEREGVGDEKGKWLLLQSVDLLYGFFLLLDNFSRQSQ
jgi:hypothetical protein